MRIALVALPNPVLASPDAHFRQGLLYVGGVLRKAGHEILMVDLRAKQGIVEADIPEADVVAMSATSGEIHLTEVVLNIARRRGARAMIGGAHPTFWPGGCLSFDYIIRGDGEIAVLDALASGTRGSYEKPLTTLGGYFPDWELIGEGGFSRALFVGAGYGQGPLAAGTLASRGCPYSCSYCRSKRDIVRYRPIEDVVIEIEALIARWGIRHYRFYDESLTLDKKRALALFAALEPLKIHIRAHTRADAWDDALAEAFKRAGGAEMGFGFESADDRVLQAIRKQETVAQYREAVRTCQKAGVMSRAFWMTSLPQETWESIEAIKAFMVDERPTKYIVSQFCPYPGSDVFEHPELYGVKWISMDFSKYWNFADSPLSDAPLVEYETVSRQELRAHYQELTAWLEKEFPR